MRWSMNHALFCVTLIARAISYELTPFLQFTIIHSAASHLSRPMGESSKMVPTLTENCFLQLRHFQIRRVERNEVSPLSQRTQRTPSGQRSVTRNDRQMSRSEK